MPTPHGDDPFVLPGSDLLIEAILLGPDRLGEFPVGELQGDIDTVWRMPAVGVTSCKHRRPDNDAGGCTLAGQIAAIAAEVTPRIFSLRLPPPCNETWRAVLRGFNDVLPDPGLKVRWDSRSNSRHLTV